MGYNNKLRAEAWVCSVANWDTTARETGQTEIATSVLDKLGYQCTGLHDPYWPEHSSVLELIQDK